MSDVRSPSPAPLYPEVGVIALSLDTWGPRWNSRHQVLTRLARYFHVTWLNPAPEWRSVASLGHVRAREVTVPGQPDAFRVRESAAWLPVVYRPAWLASALARARLQAARASLRRRGCTKIVLYLWHVSHANALDWVAHDLSCYHIYDEYSNAEQERPLDPVEERLVRSVGQVITVSPTMYARKGRLNPNSVQLSNGVDYEAFAAPAPEPADLAPIPRPRLGYSGFVKRQLDWELLLTLATRRPEWSFVVVGARSPHPDIAPLLERLEERPNVHFLGAKPTAELARYPQHFDICLMPYRMNDYTKYIYPLKLHEYLAAGRPVVSVPIPALGEVDGLVTVAHGADAWEAAIACELAPGADTPERRAARQAEAKRHDWSRIVERIASLIAGQLSLAPRAA